MLVTKIIFVTVMAASLTWASSICVTVVDPAKYPLVGVSVVVRSIEQKIESSNTTDKQGIACVESLPEGLYSVEASTDGFLSVVLQPVRLMPEKRRSLRIELMIREIPEDDYFTVDALLSGTLRLNGATVPNTRVCLRKSRQPDQEPICGTTNALGEYVITVSPGVYRAEFSVDGRVYAGTAELPSPGIYRNLLSESTVSADPTLAR